MNNQDADAALNKMYALRGKLKAAALDAMQEVKKVSDANTDPIFQVKIDIQAEKAEHIFNSLEW